MASTDAYELRTASGQELAIESDVDRNILSQEIASETEIRSLPPTDHGRDAYLVLAGCTVIQAPVWGEHLLLTSPFTPLIII